MIRPSQGPDHGWAEGWDHGLAAASVRRLLVGLIRLYQLALRPVLGPNCRFVPSCSDYAMEAIGRHGAARGGGLAALRILRCNPWHPGGLDPVPPAACGCATRPVPPTPLPDRDRPSR